MKTRNWLALSLLLVVIASSSVYLLNSANEAKRLAASPAERGWMLIEDNGCQACHQPGNSFRAPKLDGLLGSEVTLMDGSTIIADESYIRESLLEPRAKISGGYQPTMPSYQGILNDIEIDEITEAMKSKK